MIKTPEERGAIDILRDLCQLKHYKDTVGKDATYEKMQPELWKEANEFLNANTHQQFSDAKIFKSNERCTLIGGHMVCDGKITNNGYCEKCHRVSDSSSVHCTQLVSYPIQQPKEESEPISLKLFYWGCLSEEKIASVTMGALREADPKCNTLMAPLNRPTDRPLP